MYQRPQLLILGLAFLLITACADKAAVAPMTRYTLQHDNLEREYFVFLPSTYGGKQDLPVAIFMHGYGGTATGTEAEVAQGLNRYAEEYGYVMVYPQGTWFMAGDSVETQWEATTWNHISGGLDEGPDGPLCTPDVKKYPCPPECGSCGRCGWISCHDDIGFLKKLVETISTDFQIDADRFFVTGFSNGSMMVNRIACEASELFAGAALVGGRVERGFECTPKTRLPLLQMNGGRDETVPDDGRVNSSGYFYASTTSVAEHWNEGEACAADSQPWSSPTIEGKNVQCTIACGNTDHMSIDCIWPEGNHRWPGTADFRGSDGYCVTELQSASMPEQLICIEPDLTVDFWGSRLLFEFFNENQGR
jgi:polyhydroxybutyrate depolymerase